MIQTTDIPKHKIYDVKKAIEKLNRKCQKLGCKEMVVTFTDIEPIKITHGHDGHKLLNPYYLEMSQANLNYEIPNIDGYEFIAKLDLYEGTVLTSSHPDKKVPVEFSTLNKIECNHCGTKRFRKHSILLRNIESGEYIQVGSTCVKDFFHGNDPTGMMFMASFIFIFEGCLNGVVGSEDYLPGSGGEISYKLENVLEYSASVIRNFGWVSGKTAYDNHHLASTKIRVVDNMSPYTKMPRDEFIDGITEKDKEIVQKTIKHWEGIETGDSEYLFNCKKLMKLNFVPHRYMGFAVSMVQVYLRHVEEEKTKTNQDKKESKHVGKVNGRLKNLKVKVVLVREIDSDWGFSTLYAFLDEEGNLFKTFYSGHSWSLEEGDEAVVDGTVKAHNKFKGRKETLLSRVAMKELIEA